MHSVLTRMLAVLYVTSLFLLGKAEQFFLDRYHRDQNKYVDHRHRANGVPSEFEAELQLQKYGYLRCKVRRRKREASHRRHRRAGSFPEEGTTSPCSRRQVRDAVKEYQKAYHLKQTGAFDYSTRSFMSESRCGNKDNEVSLVAKHSVDVKITNSNTGRVRTARSLSQSAQQFKSDSLTDKRRRVAPSLGPWTVVRVLELAASHTQSLDRRRRYLREYVEKLRRGDPLMLKPVTEEERKKRSVVMNTANSTGQMFDKGLIRWRLLNSGYSTRIPVEDQRATIDLAFRMWSEVIPLRFVEDLTGDIRDIDIQIAFGRGKHQNCRHVFDGSGGEIAHSWHAGNMHFDDEENFKSIHSLTPDGIYLLRVAVHEIGHVLGLSHTKKTYSIMYAIYQSAHLQEPEFELGWEDRKDVQKIYGVCKGSFSTVFDWVRPRPDHQFIFNTYFFRDSRYWMYENHANRTRYGDPLYIAMEWQGVPDNVDAYVHIWFFAVGQIVYVVYFFKGEYYYEYDSVEDKVVDGWPRKIADGFGPKEGMTERIPDNVDSVFFDMRDRNIYFFKGDLVYVYDPKGPNAPSKNGCCVRIRKITEEYPASPNQLPLPSNLDTVYYSYKDQSMYFMKGEDVWKNKDYHHKHKRIQNSIVFVSKWYHKWFDICDVMSATDQQIP